ncbi:hypothetical protein ACFYXF_23350 [Streptomyces sp. NPDC002680]
MNALDFIAGQVEARRFGIPDSAPHLRDAMAVMRAMRTSAAARVWASRMP